MTDLVSEVVINDRATAALNRVAEALDKTAAAEGRVAAGADVVNQKVGSTRSIESAARAFEQLKRSADPAYDALTRLADQNTKLQRAVALGTATQAEANAVYAKLHEQANLTIGRLGGMTAAHGDLAKATRFTHTETAILRAGLINTIQSLASGAGTMQTLQTQLFQTAPAFGAVARNVNVTHLAILGLAAPLAVAAAGFAVLLQRASQAEAQMRSFSVILQATGNAGLASPQDLLSVTRSLRNTGSTTTEAQTLTEATARAPGINPAFAGTLATLARDIGAGTGQQAVAVVGALQKALLGGADAASKFVFELAGPDGLSAAQVKTMRTMEAMGNRAGAAGVAIGALQKRFGDLHEKALSPSQRLANEVTSSWQTMLDKLSETDTIQRARDALIGLFNGVAAAVATGGKAILPNGEPIGWNPAWGPYDPNKRLIPQLMQPRVVAEAQLPPPIAGRPPNFDIKQGVIMSGQAAAFADMLARAAEKLPPGYGIVVTSSGRPGGSKSSVGMGSAHVQGLAADFQIIGPQGAIPNQGADTTGLYGQAYANALAHAQKAYPDLAGQLRSGATFGARGGPISPSSPADIGHIDLRGSGALGAATGGVISNAISAEDVAALGKAKEGFDRLNTATRLWGDDLVRARAEAEALASSTFTGTAKELDVRQRATQALAQHRIELGKEITILDLRTASDQRVAEALKTSEAAAIQVQAADQARIETMQRGGDVAQRTAQILSASAAKTSIDLQRSANENERRTDLLKLEAGLQGQSADAIAVQVAHLQAKQELERRGEPLSSDIAKNYLRTADNLAAANVHLQQVTRETQRWDDLVRGVAGSVETFLTSAIENAFRGDRVTDWAATAKNALASIASQIANGLLLKPLIGSALQAFGASGNIVSQYGTFSGSGGGLSVTQTGSNTFSLSNVSSAASLGRSTGLFGDLGLSDIGGSINRFGASNFGFATPTVGLSESSIASLGNMIGIEPSSLSYLGSASSISGGGLLGGTTLTGLLGGVGAGALAGGLINSMVGGNQLFGTIGSGGGALAGSILGSILFPGVGTLLGGLLGGAGGGLFGGPLGSDRTTVSEGKVCLT